MYEEGLQHILESYHYMQQERWMGYLRADGRTIFLDSGAFSAYMMGVKIDINKFIDFCGRYQDIIRMMSVLDEIGDPDGTWRNQEEMQRQGVKPLPCYHYGEPTEVCDWYVKNYDYITIGGMVPITTPQLKIWLDRIWEEHLTDAEGKPKCKVHGFGLTSPELMRRYPWHCMTDDHEVLTRQGWVGREGVNVGDEVLCFNDGEAKWETVSRVPVYDAVEAPLHNYDYRTFSARVTSDHNWRIFDHRIGKWRWVTTDKLLPNYRIPRAPSSYNPSCQNVISDAYAEMMGWFWTEGHIKQRKRRGYSKPSITISQSLTANPAKVAKIEAALIASGEKYCKYQSVRKAGFHRKEGSIEVTFELYGPLRDWLLQMAPDKVISWTFLSLLSEKQVKLFVEASINADGWRRKLVRKESFGIRQKNPDNIELFRVACLLAGYATSREDSCHAINASSVPWCYPDRNKSGQYKLTSYTGKVWCISVPSRAFFTRCNGKIYVTGNSVDSSTWQALGSNGSIFMPDGKALAVSANAAQRKIEGQHVSNLTPPQREAVERLVAAEGMPIDLLASHHSHRWTWNVWQLPRIAQSNGHAEVFKRREQRLF